MYRRGGGATLMCIICHVQTRMISVFSFVRTWMAFHNSCRSVVLADIISTDRLDNISLPFCEDCIYRHDTSAGPPGAHRNSGGMRLNTKTQNICITFVQCWTNVEDVGPTLYECYTNVLYLLGGRRKLCF